METSIRELVIQPSHGPETGTVGQPDPLNIEFPQTADGLFQPMFIGVQQMHAPQDGMDPILARQRADVIKRVNHSGMSAAQENDHAGRSVSVNGLVVDDGVGLSAGPVEKKCPTGVFKIVLPRYLARQPETLADLDRVASGRDDEPHTGG